MENKKVKLSTIIYIVIIAILVILLIISFVHAKKITEMSKTNETHSSKNTEYNLISEINEEKNTEQNILTNNVNNNINENISNDEGNTEYSNEIKETIVLNGKQHDITLNFKTGEEIYPEDCLYEGTMRISFDSVHVKYADILKLKNTIFEKDDFKFNIIKGYDDNEYLVLETNFYANQTQTENVVYIINDKGETTSTILVPRGTGIVIDGESKNDIEFGDNSIEWYEHNAGDNTTEISVVKYRARIFRHGLINIEVVDTYLPNEVELSGKV